MPLKRHLPYMVLANQGKRRRDVAYLIPIEDGQPRATGLPRMRDCFANFRVRRTEDGRLIIKGPFSQGFYEFWVYGQLSGYDPWKHFISDYLVSLADARAEAFTAGRWRDPGPVTGPWFHNIYGHDCSCPYVRLAADGVEGGDCLLSFEIDEMEAGRFSGELLIKIAKPGVTELVLDGAEMRGTCADLITLEPVDLSERHAHPVTALPDRVKTHPRLYFDARGLERLRAERHANANAGIYADLLRLIEEAVKGIDSKEAGLWHPEGRERIFEADRLVLCAFGYLMEQDERLRDAAIESLIQIIGEDYEWPVVDNHVGMLMGALTTGYDWLYHTLSPEQRARAAAVIAQRAEEGYKMKLVDRYYRQNHFMTTTYLTVGATGFLLWEKTPEQAQRWAAFARTSLDRTLALCPDDGTYLSLWGYSMMSLVPYLEMLRQMTGEDLCATHPFFRNTGHHWLYQRTGDWRWHEGWDPNSRNTGNECAWIYRWAAAFQDPVLQWAADGIRPILLDRCDWRFAQPHRRVFEYLFRDTNLRPKAPGREQLARFFPDADQTILRSGWDKDAIVFDTRCGPLLGHNALTQGELGSYGHARLDQNSIHIYACGEDLLSRYGGGYRRSTHPCSTVLVDNRGQIGEGIPMSGPLLPQQTGYSRHFIQTDEYDYVEGVATRCYPEELELRNFTRRILYLRPDLFVVVDELAAARPRLFQWRLASLGKFTAGTERGRFTLRKTKAALDILIAYPPQYTSLSGETPEVPGYCSDLNYVINFLGIEAPHKVFETTFVSLLAPRPADAPARRIGASVNREDENLVVELTMDDRQWTVTYSQADQTDRRVKVSRGTGPARGAGTIGHSRRP